MSKCNGCGAELLDGTTFCPYCGERVAPSNADENKEVESEIINETVNIQESNDFSSGAPKEKKVFQVFATLGQIFAIITLVCIGGSLLCFGVPEIGYMICAMGFEVSIPAFIFGIIGKKSISGRKKGIFALIVGIVGTVVLAILFIVLLVLLVLNGASGDLGFTYY